MVDLSNDVLMQIISQPILSESDLSSICRVNRQLFSLAREHLYKSNAKLCRSSALCWAAEMRHLTTAQLALRHGADINIKSRQHGGSTPLILAATNNHTDVVEFLLSNGADINGCNVYHETALSVAAQEGNMAAVDMLLSHHGILAELADTSGQTPLFWACCNNHPDVVKKLMGQQKVDINRKKDNGMTPFIAAVTSGHIEVVDVLLSEEETIDHNSCTLDGRTALMLATANGHNTMVERLLGITTIDLAAQDNRRMTSLLFGIKAGAKSIVERLIAAGASIDHQGPDDLTPLATASDMGLEDIARLLLDHGADPTILDNRGWTCLHWAAQGGHFAITKLLLADGRVAPSLASHVGTTPLHCASWDGHFDVLQLLINQRDIDINCADNAGWTPLIWAAFNGASRLVRLFMEDPRVDINARDHKGRTAICFAAKKGHEDVVRALCGHQNIDLKLTDNDGKTAQVHALENRHKDLETILGPSEV